MKEEKKCTARKRKMSPGEYVFFVEDDLVRYRLESLKSKEGYLCLFNRKDISLKKIGCLPEMLSLISLARQNILSNLIMISWFIKTMASPVDSLDSFKNNFNI